MLIKVTAHAISGGKCDVTTSNIIYGELRYLAKNRFLCWISFFKIATQNILFNFFYPYKAWNFYAFDYNLYKIREYLYSIRSWEQNRTGSEVTVHKGPFVYISLCEVRSSYNKVVSKMTKEF